MMLTRLFILGFACSTLVAYSQTPCVNGIAGGYPCDNVDLISFTSLADMGAPSAEANDIWGWTDPMDGKEYVVFGTTQGTSFVDISDPVNPVYIGELPTQTSNTLWRDMKVYADHAFIVSEAGGHGMQVFDLTRLRNPGPLPAAFTVDAHYSGFGNCHNIAINEETGYAYCVGAGVSSGGLHILDISNPTNPQLAGDFAADGYTHDCQAVVYNGPDAAHQGKEIVFACNENTLTIVDVDDKTNTQQLSRVGYTGEGYTHQGWLTEDQEYFILDDELDEQQFSHATRTYIWNVQDLDNPVMTGFYEAGNNAIDHNLYIKGNLAYQSNYRAGLRILDLADVANSNLSEVAFFDLYPSSNTANFNGAWSNFPYFTSGIVAVSHIEDGLFLLKPNFFKATPQSITVCATDEAVIDLDVLAGFDGPINFVVDGSPAGVNISFSANGVSAPSTSQLTLSDFANANASYNIEVLAVGSSYTYSTTVTINTTVAQSWYADTDADNFGDPNNAVLDCSQPVGFLADNTDCDDNNADVYPGAPGTGEGIDNNCDNSVSGNETDTCPADLNNDGTINTSDVVLLISEFGCASSCQFDINGDGMVTTPDLIQLIGEFGMDCP